MVYVIPWRTFNIHGTLFIYTEQNYKQHFMPPFFMSWTQRSKTFSMYTKGLFLSNIVHKSVWTCVSEHFSLAVTLQFENDLNGSNIVCVCDSFQVSVWLVTAVWSVQWMMGNAVQCDLWCESQYDGDATSCGSRTEGHEPDSWKNIAITKI